MRAGWVLCVVVIVAACDLAVEGPGDELGAEGLRGGGKEGGGGGKWIGNGVPDPDVRDVSPAHGLDTVQGLPPDGELLSDTEGRVVATYLVECALPEGDSILKVVDGQEHELFGLVGLAPEWKDGPCDEDCQEWVSACLLARTNITGESVPVWITADHPAIGLGHPAVELGELVYEATFYGNLFQAPASRSLCRGPHDSGGALAAELSARTCDGQPLAECGIDDWGDCKDADLCVFERGLATECAAGSGPAAGIAQPTISTFVSLEGLGDG